MVRSIGVVMAIILGGNFAISELTDLLAHPRRLPRHPDRILLRALPVLLLSSLLTLITGSLPVSLILPAVLLLVIVTASNLKLRLLNEPLVFTDFMLLRAFFQHPRFYIQAVPVPMRVLSVFSFAALLALLANSFTTALPPRFAALITAFMAMCGLCYLTRRPSGYAQPKPALWHDVRRDGLLPTLILYALRCRRCPPLPAAAPITPAPDAPEATIIIQCESYAAPEDLRPGWSPLPGLQQYRKEAILHGKFLPNGFGAYTMRSEYSVMCGDEDSQLSYRQFDPFLTAGDTLSHALPRRLAHLYDTALFLHPYDLRFYGRNRLTPLWGFTDIIGAKAFTDDTKNGPYTSDAALTEYLLDYLHSHERFLAYCVTIENHGPWKPGRIGQETGAGAWHEHARNSDAMLAALSEGIKSSGRDVMLVFFGDHRPALENVPPIEGLERSTPYVILRPNAPATMRHAPKTADLTPAGLHDTILGLVSSKS